MLLNDSFAWMWTMQLSPAGAPNGLLRRFPNADGNASTWSMCNRHISAPIWISWWVTAELAWRATRIRADNEGCMKESWNRRRVLKQLAATSAAAVLPRRAVAKI